MIKSIKLINFRNFENKKIDSLEIENFIVWENWKWKTNILEAISLIWNNSVTKLPLNDYVQIWKDYFFIEIENIENEKLWFYYSKTDNKKNYLLNNKKISKKKFLEHSYTSVIFSPIQMNIMYLSPSLRRDFLDEVLKSSYIDYDKYLKDYKKILKSRNSVLKAIRDWKAKNEEIDFWDNKFINLSEIIYDYRFKLIDFLCWAITKTKQYFWWKVENIEFKYNSKVFKNEVSKNIKEYLDKNLSRDIILGRTSIWPHVDDFEIEVDWKSLIHYASRWETKSLIIFLKLLEWIFIEKKTTKKPILIIDDLFSELDKKHKDMLIKKIKYYQVFISNITPPDNQNYIRL